MSSFDIEHGDVHGVEDISDERLSSEIEFERLTHAKLLNVGNGVFVVSPRY